MRWLWLSHKQSDAWDLVARECLILYAERRFIWQSHIAPKTIDPKNGAPDILDFWFSSRTIALHSDLVARNLNHMTIDPVLSNSTQVRTVLQFRFRQYQHLWLGYNEYVQNLPGLILLRPCKDVAWGPFCCHQSIVSFVLSTSASSHNVWQYELRESALNSLLEICWASTVLLIVLFLSSSTQMEVTKRGSLAVSWSSQEQYRRDTRNCTCNIYAVHVHPRWRGNNVHQTGFARFRSTHTHLS